MAELVVNEEFLNRVERLELLLKNTVAGAFGGTHKSKTFGSSCDFTDYREYVPGDDVTKIDWNAFARFEKLYVRLYLDERLTHTRIYIDASRSMGYGKTRKARQAIRVAATLAYLSAVASDRVTVYALRGGKAEEVMTDVTGREAYFRSVNKLNDIVFEGDCRLSDSVLSVGCGYGDGLSAIISDFLTDNDFTAAFDLLADKKRDLLCVQLLAEEELRPKQRGKMHLYDSENAALFYRRNINKEIMRAYSAALDYATDNVRSACHARGGSYILVSDGDDLGKIFYDKLARAEVVK